MLSYTFINSHSHMSNSGPKGSLVLTHFQEGPKRNFVYDK